MGPLTRLTMLAISLGSAVILGQEFLYEPLVVPRLGQINEVPHWLWALVYAPEVVVCLAAVLTFRSKTEAAWFVPLGAAMVTSVQWLSAFMQQPGWHKAAEGGPEHLALQFVAVAVLLTVLLACIWPIRIFIKWRTAVA